MLAGWAALSYLVLGATGLSVDSPSPDALCPPLEATRRAVAARLGSVELDGTWRATYVLVHREQGDFIELELFDPQGNLRLERQLPAQSGNCASLPSVIALVLERFFVKPEQLPETQHAATEAPALVSAPERAEPEPAVTPAALVLPAASRAAVVDAAPSAEPGVEVGEVEPWLSLGAELWTTNAWIAPGARVTGDLGSFAWMLRAGFDLGSHRTGAFEGAVWLRRAPISLLALRELGRGEAWSVHAGVELLGVAERASATGLVEASGGFRVVPGAGLRCGARLFERAPARPFFEVSAAYLVREWAPAFRVGERDVLVPARLTLGGAFGVETNFF